MTRDERSTGDPGVRDSCSLHTSEMVVWQQPWNQPNLIMRLATTTVLLQFAPSPTGTLHLGGLDHLFSGESGCWGSAINNFADVSSGTQVKLLYREYHYKYTSANYYREVATHTTGCFSERPGMSAKEKSIKLLLASSLSRVGPAPM